MPRFKLLNYHGNATNKRFKRFSLRGKNRVQRQ